MTNLKRTLMVSVALGLMVPAMAVAQISQTGAASNSGDAKDTTPPKEDFMETPVGRVLQGIFDEIAQDDEGAESAEDTKSTPVEDNANAPLSIVPVQNVAEESEATEALAEEGVEAEPVVLSDISPALLQAIKAQGKILDKSAIKGFYSSHGGKLYWAEKRGLHSNAEHLIEVLEEAWSHGLNPAIYHSDEIIEITSQRDYYKYDVLAAQLDVLLTDAFARYVRDLSGMRVSARAVGVDRKHWRQRISAKEALMSLPAEQLAEGRFEAVLESAAPQSATYTNLRRKLGALLDEYNAEGGQAEHHISIDLGGRILKPGWSHREMPKLRAFLGASLPSGEGEMNYDPALEDAVKEFQTANGLKPDGLVGPQTLQVMNKTLRQKIDQVIVNLERMRWVERNKPERYVVVNIPSGQLWAIDNGAVKVEMPVIVGRVKRETPSFVTSISGVRLNPTWTIPPTIKKKDIWPKIIQDPTYTLNRGIELTRVSADGEGREVIDPTTIDWFNTSWNELNGMRMVQTPGQGNPLGLYRVLMPNRHNIYLHDTDQKHYFERSDHAVSSGCIRMKYPEKMTEFIFESKANWSQSKTESVIEKGDMRDIMIDERIPVYLLYHTAWSGKGGDAIIGRDIYGWDEILFQELKKQNGVFIPLSKS